MSRISKLIVFQNFHIIVYCSCIWLRFRQHTQPFTVILPDWACHVVPSLWSSPCSTFVSRLWFLVPDDDFLIQWFPLFLQLGNDFMACVDFLSRMKYGTHNVSYTFPCLIPSTAFAFNEFVCVVNFNVHICTDRLFDRWQWEGGRLPCGFLS